jgi:hypothetical protein
MVCIPTSRKASADDVRHHEAALITSQGLLGDFDRLTATSRDLWAHLHSYRLRDRIAWNDRGACEAARIISSS